MLIHSEKIKVMKIYAFLKIKIIYIQDTIYQYIKIIIKYFLYKIKLILFYPQMI